jgi:hypothetical protein
MGIEFKKTIGNHVESIYDQQRTQIIDDAELVEVSKFLIM